MGGTWTWVQIHSATHARAFQCIHTIETSYYLCSTILTDIYYLLCMCGVYYFKHIFNSFLSETLEAMIYGTDYLPNALGKPQSLRSGGDVLDSWIQVL
jgi:hypothetical protein